eukprot:COSAG02_NODE_10508_length_1924_cov_5.931544_2_plen_337_part_01
MMDTAETDEPPVEVGEITSTLEDKPVGPEEDLEKKAAEEVVERRRLNVRLNETRKEIHGFEREKVRRLEGERQQVIKEVKLNAWAAHRLLLLLCILAIIVLLIVHITVGCGNGLDCGSYGACVGFLSASCVCDASSNYIGEFCNFAPAYTLRGCDDPALCGTYLRMEERGGDVQRRPLGDAETYSQVTCSPVPAYQLAGGPDSPVLYYQPKYGWKVGPSSCPDCRECHTVEFRTSTSRYGASSGTFTIAGYGQMPTRCHQAPGSSCTLEVCAPELQISTLAKDAWFFSTYIDNDKLAPEHFSGAWRQLFRQTAGNYRSAEDWLSYNAGDFGGDFSEL